MRKMPAEGIKIEKHFRKNLGQYFTDGFGQDGRVVKGLNALQNHLGLTVAPGTICLDFLHYKLANQQPV